MKKVKTYIYAVLDEDRGGDTIVTLHRDYKSAKSKFDEIINQLKEHRDYFESEDLLDDDSWIMYSEHHLGYDFNDSWGNIKLIREGDNN